MEKKAHIDLKPTQILVLSFGFVILVGALLLTLPIMSNDGHSVAFVDALFTSTSAVCVTGLVVVNTLEQWTFLGKIVILLLIQIGGLGFMTLSTFMFILLGKKITLKERLIIQEALNQYTLSGMVRLTKNVIIGTAIVEGIGAILLMFRFVPDYQGYGVFMAIFHSVSSFCNAGFDIVGRESLVPYVGDPIVNITVMLLIIIGGLGFTVWLDILKNTKDARLHHYGFKRWFQKLSLHSKMVLVLTVNLIIIGAVFFYLVEGYNPNTLGGESIPTKIMGSFFQSVTSRTAGYNTIDQAAMSGASKFMTIILMFIGGSPAGTAGGIKTVTFGILFLTVVSVIKSKDDVEVFHRRIPWDIVKKSLAVAMLSIVMVIAVTMGLSIAEKGALFIEVFFETVSAFATVGLTLGITGSLTVFSKLLLCLTMFVGRVGPVTLIVALALRNRQTPNSKITMPEERVLVG